MSARLTADPGAVDSIGRRIPRGGNARPGSDLIALALPFVRRDKANLPGRGDSAAVVRREAAPERCQPRRRARLTAVTVSPSR